MTDDLIADHEMFIRAAGLMPSSITSRRQVLRALHRALPLGLAYATTADLAAWFANPDWSRATRKVYFAHVAQFFAWASAEGFVDRNPMLRLKRPPEPVSLPRPLGEDVIALLLEQPEPMPTIVLLGAYEGMRRAEIAACRREHVSEELLLIPVAKGGEPGTVPTHPLVWEHVRDRGPGPLVLNRFGNPMRAVQISEYFRWHRRRLGLPETLVPHMLRHRYGTELQRAGRDLRVTQECMRHKRIANTQLYTAVTDQQRRAAVELLPGPL